MFTNLQEFNSALQKWASTVPSEQVDKLARYLAVEGLKRVVQKTPVDSGLARGNWQVAIGSSGSGKVSTVDPTGQSAIAQGTAQINKAPSFPFISIFNDLDYIDVIEYGGFVPENPGPSKDPRPGRFGRILVRDGYSVQAPRGMVTVTIAELREVLP